MEITSIEIEKNGLAKLLGSDRFSNVPRSTRSKIEKLGPKFHKLAEPSLHHQNTEIHSVQEDVVQLEKGPVLKSSKLSKTLRDCNEVVCYIATLGGAVENEIKRLMDENHLSEAFILDAMASVAADNMVARFHHHMQAAYKNQQQQVTLCFSPGYCDWPVTDQKKLFGIFDAGELDVELTESCFMKPRKSISGVFGITPSSNTNPRKDAYNPCVECNRQTCSTRRA